MTPLGFCNLWHMNKKHKDLFPSTLILPSRGEAAISCPPHSTVTQQLSTLQFPMATENVIIALDM